MLQAPLFTTAAGSVLWAPEIPGLMLRLQGDVRLAQYQLLLNHGLQLYTARTHPATPAHWIADLRQLSALQPDAHHWMATDWHPRAYAAGLRHLRVVAPATPSVALAQQRWAGPLQAAGPTLHLTQHATLEAAIQQARTAVASAG